MSEDSIYSVEVDYSATASPSLGSTTGRIGSAPASSQGAKVVAGYDTNTLLAPFRLDAGGNLRTAPSSPSGSALYVANASAPVSPYYGLPIMARQDLPSPSNWQALNSDPSAALNVHNKSKATYKFILPSTAGGAAGKSMMSIVNGSTTAIIRVQQINIGTPYVNATGQSILGLSGTFNRSVLMLHELRRITTQTKGASTTVLGYSSCDSADTLDANVVVMSNATVSGAAANPWHRQDANSPSGLYWYYRVDPNSKTLVLRPGEGASVNTISDTSSYTFDLEITITSALG